MLLQEQKETEFKLTVYYGARKNVWTVAKIPGKKV